MSAFYTRKEGKDRSMKETNLEEFIEAVNLEIDKQIAQIEEQAEQKRKELIENTENTALKDAYSKIKNCTKEEDYKSKIAVSKARQEARVKVLTYRESLVAKIFDTISDKLFNFTESEEYPDFLYNLLKNEKTGADTVVFIRKKDMKFEAGLRKLIGPECSLETDDNIVYGGLSVYNKNTSVLINKTIDDMLEEQKKSFASKYKLV